MKNHLAILSLVLCSFSYPCFGQTAVDSTAQKSTNTPGEVKVEGLWELTSYLGKKLGRQFSDRLNLQETEPDPAPKPVKVTVVLGPFRIERTDSR